MRFPINDKWWCASLIIINTSFQKLPFGSGDYASLNPPPFLPVFPTWTYLFLTAASIIRLVPVLYYRQVWFQVLAVISANKMKSSCIFSETVISSQKRSIVYYTYDTYLV